MRSLCALVLLATVVVAGDLVHLKNGRILRGTVVAETKATITLDLGGGRMAVPRNRIRLIERGAGPAKARHPVTQRDEWFLVLHRDKVAGWRRVVHTEGPRRVTVEERTVFFRPGGGDDVDIRRVETADAKGRPLEFLLMETYGREMELTSGQFARGQWVIHITRAGATRSEEFMGGPFVLALPAWSRFLETARPGEVRKIRALDLRRLKVHDLLLRRDEDAAPPSGAGTKPCHSLAAVGDFRQSRAFYRPGEGSVAVELNGATLVARRSTRERVELARRAHAAPLPIQIKEALQFPFYRRPKALKAYYPRAGFSLAAPDAGWMRTDDRANGRHICSFEKIGLFASLDVFAYEATGLDADQCLGRALARLRLTATSIEPVGPAQVHRLGAHPARTVRLRAHHRGEDLRCRLTVVVAPDRYLVIVGACPERRWRWAEKDFASFVGSLALVR